MLQSPIVPILLMLVVFWFLLIRPQTKRQKEHQEMVASLKKGDKVVTNGGIYGSVVGVSDKVVVLRVADNVKLEVAKQCVASLQPTKPEE
jgi:preprotein translocase subunit YajC